jgi:hypothetical protein
MDERPEDVGVDGGASRAMAGDAPRKDQLTPSTACKVVAGVILGVGAVFAVLVWVGRREDQELGYQFLEAMAKANGTTAALSGLQGKLVLKALGSAVSVLLGFFGVAAIAVLSWSALNSDAARLRLRNWFHKAAACGVFLGAYGATTLSETFSQAFGRLVVLFTIWFVPLWLIMAVRAWFIRRRRSRLGYAASQ